MTFSISRLYALFRLYFALSIALIISKLMQVLFTLWSYRKKIIVENLRRVFPARSQKRIRLLVKSYYHHMSDLCAEAVLIPLAGRSNIPNFITYKNLDLLDKLHRDNKNIILLCSHYGNWEYLSTLPLFSGYEIFAPYSAIKQGWLNNFIYRIRSSYGVRLIEKKAYYKFALSQKSTKPVIHVIIADQRPLPQVKLQVSFFNQQLYAQQGAERLSQKKDFVTLYLDVNRKQRFSYSYEFKEIQPDSIRHGGITQAYFSLLEKTILRAPGYWLWSHRRWAAPVI